MQNIHIHPIVVDLCAMEKKEEEEEEEEEERKKEKDEQN